MELRQSFPFRKYLEAGGWRVIALNKNTYAYLYPTILGNVMRVSYTDALPLQTIISLAKVHNVLAIKLELKQLHPKLKQYGFRKDTWSIEPSKTLVINVTQNIKQLLLGCKPKWRQNIRFATKAGVSLKLGENIDTFLRMWQLNGKNKGYRIEKAKQSHVLWQELRNVKRAHILIAYVKEEPVAAVLLLFWEKTCHLWHLAYSGLYPEYKPLYLLVWEAICFAKRRGAETFDFEGIGDDRYPLSHTTQSSYFKKGFGGEEKAYAGSFVRFFNPLLSVVYRVVSKAYPILFRTIFKSKPIDL